MVKIIESFNIKKFLTVYVVAAVVDLIVWFVFSESYRQTISAMGIDFPWHIDITITLVDALFLLVTGATVGKIILGRIVSKNTFGRLLILALTVFFVIYFVSFLLALIWVFLFEYYTVVYRQQAIVILGALSSLFAMVYLMDEFSMLIVNKERNIAALQLQKKQEEEIAKRREEQIVANKYADNHFMFNSLSVLFQMMEKGDADAKSFIKDLISCVRFMTTSTYEALVPLERELENVYHYYNIVIKRFGGDTVMLTVDSSLKQLESEVVPMSLTSLVQNTIKHNAFSRENPLQIRVFYDEEYIVVENKIAKRYEDSYGPGSGLYMLKRQYESYSEKPVLIINNGEKFLVKIPALIF